MTPDGAYYMAYLCGRRLDGKYTILGRETALDPVTFTPDGWPIVNGLKGPSALQLLPDFVRQGGLAKEAGTGLQAPAGHIKPMDFVTPRAPEEGAIRYLPNGTVRLLSSPAPLRDKAARNIFLRRQEHFNFTARAILALPPLAPGQEAGLIAYYDENSWAFASIRADEDGLFRFRLSERIGHEDRLSEGGQAIRKVPALLAFSMRAEGLKRSFWIGEAGPEGEPLAPLFEAALEDTSYLADEGLSMGKRFTGAMVGACGVGGASRFHYDLIDFVYEGA